ncbi:MAG: o-succinylbenzoate synthase [Mangrovibacterium sp.]
MKASIHKYELSFREKAQTSRETLTNRLVWYIKLQQNNSIGIGECAPLFGLSKETKEEVEDMLQDIISDPDYFIKNLHLLDAIPSAKFALETAFIDLQNGGIQKLYNNDFVAGKQGISINGLIWMNDAKHMLNQIDKKLAEGFTCIKLKIGALNFNKELELIKHIRRHFSPEQITIRVDANGGFNPEEVLVKLEQLASYQLHSIEQPIKAGNWAKLARLCENSPLPIALDEELIGINTSEDKQLLLDLINPSFLVLKPSLHGGISGCDEWIKLAEERDINWWITSYLESNIGLNAIAQWAASKALKGHQGLGTGQLFTNNIDSPLEIKGEKLFFNSNKNFNPDHLLPS